MRSLSSLGLALAIGVFTLVSSGCNLAELRDSNRRLKEANERLIVQKNQLEQELALHQQSTGSKDAEIARLRSQLDSVLRTPVATTPERIPAPAPDEFRDLGLGEHVNPVTVSSNIGALPGARDVICSKFGHVRNHRRSLCYRFSERSTRHATTL